MAFKPIADINEADDAEPIQIRVIKSGSHLTRTQNYATSLWTSRVEDLSVDQIGDAYLLDFVGPPSFVQQLSPKVDRVIILDHHKTAVKMLEDGEFDSENVTKVIDGRSGATISYEYFKEKISALVNGNNTSCHHKFEHRNRECFYCVIRIMGIEYYM